MGGTFGKHGSWVVDHTMDDIPLGDLDDNSSIGHGSIATITGGGNIPAYEDDPTRVLETKAERKARKISHWVAYSTMFVMSIGFSIVLSGVWPYLSELEPDVSKESLGWVVAANPFGQMVASPLLGIWGNKAGTIRWACITTVLFFIIGNAMYAILNVFKGVGYLSCFYAMIVSRFIVGVSSGNVTLCRSYIAGSTTLKERTFGIAIIAAAQALGFVVGPGIQTILTMSIPDPVDTGSSWFIWDQFSAAGWIAALLGFINLIILTPFVFKEHYIADKERALLNVGREKDDQVKLPKPDYLSLSGVLFGFWVTIFIYVLMEALAVPFVMDEYAWTEKKAMIVVGIALSGAGILTIPMFTLSGFLAKKFDERYVNLIVGYIPLIIGTFLFLPWGNAEIPLNPCNETLATTEYPTTTTESSWLLSDTQNNGNYRHGNTAELYEDDICVGCPPITQEWCEYTPQLPLAQLLVAFITIMLGYPIAQSIGQALYSKILGPKPQGLWMGVLTGVGSFSRIMGPIFMAYVYTDLGPRWTFGVLVVGMVLAALLLIILHRRLVPMKMPDVKINKQGYDGPAAEKY